MMGRIQRQPAQVQVDFLRVCCHYWKNEGNYSIEDAKLEAMDSYETLVKYRIIKEEGNDIVIDFLDEQLESIDDRRKQASEAGKRSAEARKRRAKSNDRSTTVQRPLNEGSTESNRVEKSREEKSRGDKDSDIDKEVKKERKKYFEDEKLNSLFEDFMDYRKQMKKPMTDRSITMHVNKLNAESVPNAIKMIERSIEHGWSSLYELKEKDKVADDTAGDLENGWRVVPMSEAYEIVRDLSFTSMHEAELRGEGDEYVRKVMNARVQYEVHGNAWKTRK
jgi:hypothetical protein